MNQPKRRGRKSLPEGEGKRVPLNMRTTQDVRDRLEAAATLSGRSLAQEVERRLEQSFETKQTKSERYGGEHNVALLECLGFLIKGVEHMCGGTWASDPFAHQQVQSAIATLLEAFAPPPTEGPPPFRLVEQLATNMQLSDEMRGDLLSDIGAAVARGWMNLLDRQTIEYHRAKPLEGMRVFETGEPKVAAEIAPILKPLLWRKERE